MKNKKLIILIPAALIILFFLKQGIAILQNVEVYKYDSNGNEIYSCGGKDKNQIYSKYNEKNQLIERKSVFGDEITYLTFEYENDLLKKIIHKSDYLPDENYEISYDYNAKNQKIKETDSRKGATLYEYDDKSNIIRKTLPNNESISYKYDQNGNEVYEESTDGGIAESEFDSKGRIVKETYKNLSYDGKRICYWEYYEDGSIKWINASDKHKGWILTGKNGELLENGFDDLVTKYIKKTVYYHWKNGQVKTKKIYTLWHRDYTEKK